MPHSPLNFAQMELVFLEDRLDRYRDILATMLEQTFIHADAYTFDPRNNLKEHLPWNYSMRPCKPSWYTGTTFIPFFVSFSRLRLGG